MTEEYLIDIREEPKSTYVISTTRRRLQLRLNYGILCLYPVSDRYFPQILDLSSLMGIRFHRWEYRFPAKYDTKYDALFGTLAEGNLFILTLSLGQRGEESVSFICLNPSLSFPRSITFSENDRVIVDSTI